MSDLFKINLVELPSSKVLPSTLDRLKKTWVGRIYIQYLKPIPIVRGGANRAWRLLYPIYTKVLASLPYAGSAKTWRSLIKMQDYVSANQRPCQQIFGPVRVETPAPKVLPAEDQALLIAPRDHYVFPAVYVAELGQAMVCGGSNLVFVDGAVMCHDLYDFERDYTSEELHGRHLIDPKANRMRLLHQDPMPIEIDCAASFVDACAVNYAHWMTEVLPRVSVFCDVPAYAEVPIIVNAGLHPNIMQSLALVVGGQRKVMLLPVGRSIKVNNLVQTSVTGYVPFEKRNKQLKGHGQGFFNPLALKSVREKLRITIECGFRKKPEKVYFQRTSALRNVENAKEIDKIISEAGYSFNDPGGMTFIDQVGLVTKANNVVAATGAALCNAIFCDEKTSIFVLMGKHEDMIYRYWANMLQPLGLNVFYVLGEQLNASEKSIHGDFKIDVALLKEAIKMDRNIHPTALVSPKAKIGIGVEIGCFTIIHDNVEIGDFSKIGSHCEIGIKTPLGDGSPLKIGNYSQIRSHSVFYDSSAFGAGLITGHSVNVRENTQAGVSFQIGTASEIQGNCVVGDYVRFQSNVFVGKKTKIGNFVWVLPHAILTNDPTPPSNTMIGCELQDYACISAGSVILPGVVVGEGALVAAHACVTKNVPAGMLAAGVPATISGAIKDIKLRDGSGRYAYPWIRHFQRGYPEAVIKNWEKTDKENDA